MPKRKAEILYPCLGFGDQPPHECGPADFYADKYRSTGRSSRCKTCLKARNNEYFRTRYYPENRQKLIDRVIDRRKADKEN